MKCQCLSGLGEHSSVYVGREAWHAGSDYEQYEDVSRRVIFSLGVQAQVG